MAARIGLRLPPANQAPQTHSIETVAHGDIDISKMSYESEPGINIPALLIKSRNAQPGSPTYIFVSDKGKPITFENSGLPFRLANHGSVVLAMDVRGIGETSPTPPLERNRFTGYTPLQWAHDALAIDSLSFGRTTLCMRTFDVLRGIDFLNHCDDLKGRKIVVVGEGLGGLWALLAAAYDSRVEGVVTIGTLPTYKLLITNQYYNVWGYFWVPGALRDFDIPDLARLAPPKPQVWIDPVDALGERIEGANASSILGSYDHLHLMTSDPTPAANWVQRLDTFFK